VLAVMTAEQARYFSCMAQIAGSVVTQLRVQTLAGTAPSRIAPFLSMISTISAAAASSSPAASASRLLSDFFAVLNFFDNKLDLLPPGHSKLLNYRCSRINCTHDFPVSRANPRHRSPPAVGRLLGDYG
jgi:hypothetical protein